MFSNPIPSLVALGFMLLSLIGFSQNHIENKSVSTKDLAEHLYQHHLMSFELKRNEKKGMVFVDYLSDGTYNYEIALLDRNPVHILDSEDIFKITLTDTTKSKLVYQNVYDKGINDIQDFDKETIEEFSRVLLSKPSIKLIPVYSFEEIKLRVYQLQHAKISHSESQSKNKK